MARVSRVYLAQALCPKRHAILAHAAEFEDEVEEAEAKGALETMQRRLIERAIAQRVINDWCDLCGAPSAQWTFEVSATQWQTVEEATPRLREIEREQAATRAHFQNERRKASNN
jgi:hypothetical protein